MKCPIVSATPVRKENPSVGNHWNECRFRRIIQAVPLGNSSAMFRLGGLYESGNGVAQSYEKAVELYQKAADLGDANAMHNQGFLYAKGKGVSKSYEKAEELFRQAAENGKTDAMYVLDLSYENGSLGIVDQEKLLNGIKKLQMQDMRKQKIKWKE